MHQSFDWKEAAENIIPLDLDVSLQHLSDALHNYISACMASAAHEDHSHLRSAFGCLTMCSYVCAGKSEGRCISHLIKSHAEVAVLHGAVTFGRMLNAERNRKC